MNNFAELLQDDSYTDEMLTIGISGGPVTNTTVTPRAISWDDFKQQLNSPEIEEKNGTYFTCLSFTGNHRNGENAQGQTASVFVLDGDSRIDPATGEILTGAPAPGIVSEVLKSLGITHCIYSSHSNGEKGNRYRVVIPCEWMGKEELEALVGWIIHKLHEAQLWMNPVPENLNVACAWFMPRVPDEAAQDAFEFHEHDGGEPFPKEGAMEWYAENHEKSSPAIDEVVTEKKGKMDESTPIGKFNAEHDNSWMSETLVNQGYRFDSITALNRSPAYRYCAPKSESGTAGALLYQTERGVWRVYSHHGEHDPLSDGNAHDAFDLFTLFEHKSDEREAFTAIGVPQSWSREELKQIIDDADKDDPDQFMEINKKLASSGLSEVDVDTLHRAIKQKSGIALGALRKDLKTYATQIAEDKEEKKLPNGNKLMLECLDHYGSDKIVFAEDKLWRWEDRGVWSAPPDKYLDRKLIMEPIVEMYGGVSFTSNLIRDVRGLMDRSQAIDGYMQPHTSEHYINAMNGELHWNSELEEWELGDHDKTHLSTNQCGFSFDVNATCPKWGKFTQEIFENTGTQQDIDEQIELLQAMIGYSMTTSTALEKFILLQGPGGDGKSVVMRVMEALMGSGNSAAVQPNQLSNKFQLAHMDKKLINIVTEIGLSDLMPDDKIKSICSGELCTVEHKNKNPFETAIYATLWFCSNPIPSVRDYSDAFFERAVMFKLPNKFRGTSQQDVNLGDKLKAELDGIAMRCLNSYGAVLKAGGGVKLPRVVERNIEEWRGETDQVRNFAEDNLIFDAEADIALSELYRDYIVWGQDMGMKHLVTQQTLNKRLIAAYGLEKGHGTGHVAVMRGVITKDTRARVECLADPQAEAERILNDLQAMEKQAEDLRVKRESDES